MRQTESETIAAISGLYFSEISLNLYFLSFIKFLFTKISSLDSSF